MSQFNLDPDFNQRLLDSIEHPNDILANMGLVLALLNLNVIAPNPLFAVNLAEHQVVPVFTTESDWEVFLSNLPEPPEGVQWQENRFMVVFNAALETPIDSIGFNLKTAKDKPTGNLYYSDKIKLKEFIETYGELMEKVMNPANQAADRLEKVYLVPVYVGARSYGDLVRVFPTLISPSYDHQELLPVFDNIQSFMRWYRQPEFGGTFAENNGQIRGLRLSELRHPSMGENQFGATVGVVINPMEIEKDKEADFIVRWEELGEL